METVMPKQPSQTAGEDSAQSVPDTQSSWNSGQDGGYNSQNNRSGMGRGYHGGQGSRGFDARRDNRQFGGNSRNFDQDRGYNNRRDYGQYRGNPRNFDQGRGYNNRRDDRQYRGNSRSFDQENDRQNPPTDTRESSQNHAGNRWSYDRTYNGRGSYGKGSYGRGSYDHYQKMDDTSISKNLSTILRHTAEKVGLELDRNGFIFIDDLLKLKRFSGVTVDDLQRIVSENDKQRFTIETDGSSQKLKIRANQGHSQKFQKLELGLTPVDDPEKFPIIVHGTYLSSWDIIRKEGLKTMKRVHIHFAPGLPGEDGVISGMRTSCEVLIYIDLEKALKDGLEFFMSSNNVVLSSGDKDGVIAPKYFKSAVNRKYGKPLDLGESSPSQKKLPVGMVESDLSKDKGANKKHNKTKKDKNQAKNSTEMETSNLKKNNQAAEDSANEEKSKKSKQQNDTEENSTASYFEKPKEKVAEKPKEKVAEKPKEKVAEKPNEKVAEKPKEKVAEKPKEKGAEKPNEKGAEKPKEKGAEKPNEKGAEKTKEKGAAKPEENYVKKLTDDAAEGQEKKVSPSKETENTKKTGKGKTNKPAPKVYLIESAEDEKLEQLKDKAIFSVHALKKENEIVYVLISMPNSVFVFDPVVMKEFLKPLLENEKCKKVMFDECLNDEMSKQLEIVMYEKPVADVQILFCMSEKRRLVNLSELVGEICEKLSLPADASIDDIAVKLSEKPKNVRKTIAQAAELVHLYEKYKPILDSEDGTSIDQYNNLHDATKNKICRIFGGSKAVEGEAEKE